MTSKGRLVKLPTIPNRPGGLAGGVGRAGRQGRVELVVVAVAPSGLVGDARGRSGSAAGARSRPPSAEEKGGGAPRARARVEWGAQAGATKRHNRGTHTNMVGQGWGCHQGYRARTVGPVRGVCECRDGGGGGAVRGMGWGPPATPTARASGKREAQPRRGGGGGQRGQGKGPKGAKPSRGQQGTRPPAGDKGGRRYSGGDCGGWVLEPTAGGVVVAARGVGTSGW
ncbi:glycine-rich cell wall structural protein 1.8-like [Hevea brasiliensis]|uniref:glycine-rich cell wall structural protein 1.8-like n=1 Tax=Hevea brasiliensis TaxID=3981 RepID=UPI0025F78E30|nr:glycine-rich cell wall structural protein 1.8-like [Hevea brasiliensis]